MTPTISDQWPQRILLAPTKLAVAELLREYQLALLPSDLAKVPEGCQKLIMEPSPDIHGNAVRLLRYALTFTGDEHACQFLHDVAQVFAAGSTRLNQLESLSR